ncbi:related to epimerase, homolog [Lecanosticta acicola]|uniref:Related to epimerase, homolog n=1 Tax=Lecanosticta acicola TaxID=111012 RepID=A0AAI9EBQ0_9PEZI|nr:related to epimerase, homolog [Lecanosticta acicola]
MPRLPFVTLDVFTQTRYAGNPLAVVRVPADTKDDVSGEQMQRIAREFNLSETIFLHEDGEQEGEWRVRIFLTDREIPFAGHPTIGCAVYALSTLSPTHSQGRFIANAGPIDLQYANGTASASIPHNFHLHTQHARNCEEVLNIQPALKTTLTSPVPIDLISPVKGMNFLAINLPTLDSLARVTTSATGPTSTPDDEWQAAFTGTYFYVHLPSDPDTDTIRLQARMIAGPLEDPATGKYSHDDSLRKITQGLEIGRRSDIGVTVALNATRDAIERVVLRGEAVKVMEGIVEC